MNNTMSNTIKSISDEATIDSNTINFDTLTITDNNKQKTHYNYNIELKDVYKFELLEHKLHTIIYTINKKNIILFKDFNNLLITILNSFHILLNNSSLCTCVKDGTQIIYRISDYTIANAYTIINSYTKNNTRDLYLFINNFIDTNKLKFKNYNNFLKNLIDNDNNDINKNTIINTIVEFISVIQSFDMSNDINNFYNPIYMKYINLYTLAQTTLQKACDTSSHNIDNNVKTLILDELKKARLLLHHIKTKIETLTLTTPELVTHLDTYVNTCKSTIALYK
jgi:hypothetical protein